MRILNVIASMDPVSGGPGEWVRQFGAAAEKMGHSIEAICMDDPQAKFLGALPVRTKAFGAGLYQFYSRGFLTWLKAHAGDYDALVAHGLWRFPSVATRLAARHCGKPYFIYPHGMLDPWFKTHYPRKHLFKSLYWPLTDGPVLRDASGVIFTCHEEQRLAENTFWPYRVSKSVILPLGIADPPDASEGQRKAFLQHFEHLDGKRLLLFMSRIHPKKGVDSLLRAFATVSGDDTLHLVLAGPDQEGYRAQLEALAAKLGIESRITWTGMLTGDLKWGALRCAEALSLTSHQENFGIIVVEALACGVPVLISDKVNIHREIIEAGAGLYAADTEQGATDMLAHWLSMSAEERSRMRVRARECFLQNFEITNATATLMDYLSRAATKPSVPPADSTAS